MTDSAGVAGHSEAGEQDEPKTGESKRWLSMIEDAEHAFRDWQSKADNIDKLYANLNDLASAGRDRQFQMFWANIQVLGPSVYSRPPVPVVVPRFKDRKPVPRAASELLERSTSVGFELEDIDGLMRAVRDDLTVVARGCAWVRYETNDDGKGQRVCFDFADRKDFLHPMARTWKEVPWVSKRSWLTEDAMEKRFKKHSGNAYEKASYEIRKDDNGRESEKKAGVWEIWHKEENKVVWVTEGVEVTLDEDKPHLDLEGFFPCPKPAYSTVQRRSLLPVPDMLFYKDQLEEINELTARIGALADAVQVRGFYPAGAGEIGDAIETAIKSTVNNQVLVPISNWAMVGQGGVKDMIVWLPIDQITTTIVQLVELRRQIIEDVYEITGLSDIMRGATEASETATAQQLKSQYGSVRIKDRQAELVRFARDLVRIAAEIMAENFLSKTLLEMSQFDIPTDADIKKQIQPLEAQIKQIIAQVEQAKADPQLQAQAQQNPQAAQQVLQQAQQQAQGLKGQIDKLNETATVEKVMKLLRDQKIRPFVLDIETDSTIAPDENAQKQRATEFVTAVGGFMGQVIPMVQQVPQSAKLAAETLKYVASQFRAGRQLEQTIEEFADDMAAVAAQPKQDPAAAEGAAKAEQVKQQMAVAQARHDREQQTAAVDQQRKDAEAKANQDREIAKYDADMRGKAAVLDATLANLGAEEQRKAQEHGQAMDKGALEIEKLRLEIEGVKVKTASTVATTQAKVDQANTATDNSIRSTDASVQATADSTAIKRDAAKAKEPA
ncbi:hypothetical protein [Bradyrhizobium sp.]|jgi:hypothetical protein|uniref:hypothetical protein n=1 Tax=Bradyrhizobium sp. TaxID=376 RepID=UPI002DDD0C90|nr:hypothetical protein [Bradyrhizobium sp.]HEV2160236.1 hypothetical protein [Bradyrhizobium sp.]